MWNHRQTVLAVMMSTCVALNTPARAEAGVLLDWLFGRTPNAYYPVGPATPLPAGSIPLGPAPTVANYPVVPYTANYGAVPAVAMPTTPTYANPVIANSGLNQGNFVTGAPYVGTPVTAGYAGIPQPQVNFLPSSNYETQYYRVPVTYYRPMVTTDPRTGQQVTTMAPCTSYQMQARRVPTLSLFGSRAPIVTYPATAPMPATYAAPPPAAVATTSTPLPSTIVQSTVPVYSNIPGYNTLPSSAIPNGTIPNVSGYPNTMGYPNTVSGAPLSAPAGTPAMTPMAAPYNGGNYVPTTPSYSQNIVPQSGSTYPPAASNYQGTTPPPAQGTIPGYNYPSNAPAATAPIGTGTYPPGYNAAPNYNTAPGYIAPPATPAFNAAPGTNGISDPAAHETPRLGPGASVAPSTSSFGNAPPTNNTPTATNAAPTQPNSNNVNNGFTRTESKPESKPEVAPQSQPAAKPENATAKTGSEEAPKITGIDDSENRARVQNVVRQPIENAKSGIRSIERVDSKSEAPPAIPLTPIPTPQDFQETPRWNPGLLNSSDRTASLPAAPAADEFKSIQWASFQSEMAPKNVEQQANQGLRPVRSVVANKDKFVEVPVATTPPGQVIPSRSARPLAEVPTSQRRYDTGGWKPTAK